MLILSVSLVFTVLLICAAVVAWKFVEEYDILKWWTVRKRFNEIREIILEKAEIGDRLNDEEMKMLYKLVK